MRSYKFPKMFDSNSSRIWRADEYSKATRQNVLLLLHSERGELECDPYFGILETYSFALAVCASNIEIEIITSSDLLREIDGKSLLETTGCTPQEAKDKNIDTEEFETGNVLKKHITKIIQKDTTIKNITVNVMRGKAVFHDRFIIIDDTDVWFSGNSFNSIGKKVGAIIKLPNPSEMLEILAKIHNEPDFLLPIDTWLKKRQENKEEKNVLP